MCLTKSEKLAQKIIDIASEEAMTLKEFFYSMDIAKEIIKRTPMSRQCLEDYEFPSQHEPPDISGLFSGS